MTGPSVSVLMAVHDGERHLQATIDSILGQTYGDFEFVIVDDGSHDRTAEILDRQRDPRIRVHRNDQNMGVAAATNVGLGLCRGEYIARTDGDDISAPDRFERQVRELEARPEVGLCATRVQLFGATRLRVPRVPTSPRDIVAELVFNNCIAHSSVMMRRDVLLEHALSYDPTLLRSLDYDLLTRLAPHTTFITLAEPLVRYRVHERSLSATGAAVQRDNRSAIALRYLRRIAAFIPDELLELHREYMLRDFRRLSRPEFFRAWAQGLLDLPARSSLLTSPALEKALSARVAEVYRWPSLRRVRAAAPILSTAIHGRRLELLGYGAAAACLPGPVWGYLRSG